MNTPLPTRHEGSTQAPRNRFDIEGIYLQYHDRLYRHLVHLVSDRDQAEELVQDVFVRVLLALPKMSNDLHLSAWLYRIATNIGYDALRRRRRIAWQPLDELDVEPAGGDEDDPQVHYGRAELVRLSLSRLPPGYRQALLLSTQEGYSYAQIASLLNIAESGAKMYLSRARRQFRQHYLDLEAEADHG